MGLCKNYIFVALCDVFLMCAVAHAYNCPCGNLCSANQYCVEEYVGLDDQGYPEYDYHCEDCGGPNQVHNPNACMICQTSTYCADYNECPDGVGGSGTKCKDVTNGCPAGTGCAKYEVCNMANGAITYEVTGACHIEGNGCYENEVDCSVFNIDVIYGKWTCAKADQTGRAYWFQSENAWNTSGCRCAVTNKNIDIDAGNTVTKCEKANASYVVVAENMYSTKKLTDSVYYTPERQYCSKCYPGYLPYIDISPLDGVFIAPAGVTSSYGVRRCPFPVSAPYYASCQIEYPLDNPGTNMCREECPDGLTIYENGATSVNDCVPTGATYTDSTGSFRLGPDSSLCQ